MFQTKVRISQHHHASGKRSIISGWLTLEDAQRLQGEWSEFTPSTDILTIRGRFGRTIGLGLMGRLPAAW